MDWKEVVLPLLLAAIAAAPGILALFRGRHKERADAASSITDSASDLLKEYRTRIAEIEQEYRDKIAKIEAIVADQAERLRCQEREMDKQAAMIRRQQMEIDEQAKRIYVLEVERSDIMRGVSTLCAQIRGLGHEPVWEPEV